MKTLAKWSINDYHQMVAAGILDNRQVELLAGETSSKRHRKLHAAIYAVAKIPEYWVLDLTAQQLRVFRNPVEDNYETETIYQSGLLKLLAFPEIAVSISKLVS
ncbi:Protein of unknown function (DUF820) [Leptolyngbya sp. PCC 7375]|nr:Protein of unknown function (DUF820) [Leptolyngbya sp. PCC 7375]